MFDYDSLQKYVEDLDKDKTDECCLICFLGNEKECVKISCGHYFHSSCLNSRNKCPYCNKKISKSKNITNNSNVCNSILKSGKRKGEECGRVNCGYHK